MKACKFILLILLFSLGAMASDVTPQAGVTPSFPLKQGWMGSDLAYSIDLHNGQFLWLFGDTYIANPNATSRHGAKRVTNSVGLSSVDKNGTYNIQYYWRNQGTDSPKDIFPHHKYKQGYLYWPKDAIVVNDVLYIALVEIWVYDVTSAMGFKEVGSKLARVSNYLSPPNQWKYEYLNFSMHQQVFPGTRFIIKDNYLYWLSTVKPESPDSPVSFQVQMPIVLQRIKISNLNQLLVKSEYLNNTGMWQQGFDLEKAKVLMNHGATEMTVHYSEPHGKWIAVYGEFAIYSKQVHLRFADQLEGPWSEPINIFEFPEMDPLSRKYVDGGFGYAAKFHPQYSDPKEPNQIVMTYVVNNLQEKRLMDQLNVYVPQVVVIDLPKLDSPPIK